MLLENQGVSFLPHFAVQETSIAWASDTSDNIVIPASKLSEDANGFCSLQLEVPDFDQMTISWTSTEDPLISVRIKDSKRI